MDGLHIFTPLARLPKKSLDGQTTDMLKSLCKKGKDGVALVREERAGFVVCAGDNFCESLVAVGKHNLRRLGLMIGKKGKIEHVDILASHYLNKNPGLSGVMRAVAVFKAKANGATGPRGAFKKPLWKI